MNPLVDQRLRRAYRRVQLQAVALAPSTDEHATHTPAIDRTSSSLPFASAGKSLDVSFKTSLVESYHRSSYTGTGTDRVDESWEEWLEQRQGVATGTAAAQGGIVDDILRLVPNSISSDTENCLAADTSLYDASGLSAFGAFSASARRQAVEATGVSSQCVCTADILALVNDVIDSHLCCPSPSLPAAKNSNSYASRLQTWSRDVYSLVDDLSWECISGASDILTVLAATSFSLLEQEVTVSVRVINSAMFKIPTFSLQVCLQADGSGGGGGS